MSIQLPAETEPKTTRTNPRQWLSIIHEFGTNTTAHGLPRVANSTSLHNRLYWLIASLCFSGLMVFFIVRAVIDYFGYPTQIDISFDPEWPQRFPAFTFCNVGRFRLDQFLPPLFNYTNTLNITHTNDTSILLDEQLKYLGPFLCDLLNSNTSMEPLFYPLSSMLVSCSYNSRACSSADFTSFISTDYGFCYTFNAKLKNTSGDSIRDGTEYDGTGNLELGLYVHSDQYVPYLADGMGIVALIHDNTEVPQMEASGFNLIPGQKHKFSYRKKTTSLVPSPYTSCSNTIEPWMQSMFVNYHDSDYGYSQSLCFKLAVQIFTYEQCGCVNPYIWDIRSIILPGTTNAIYASVCQGDDSCFRQAFRTFFNTSLGSNTGGISCPQECVRTEFIVKKSSLFTPARWQLYPIKYFVENASVALPANWSSTWFEHIYRDYLAVSIVRETTVVENNIQKPSLNLIDMLSNIGGQTGLWLGISLLSIMELFEMFYRLVRHQCTAIRSVVRNN